MSVKQIETELPAMTRTEINRPWVPGQPTASATTIKAAMENGDMRSLVELEDAEDIVEADVVSEDPMDDVMEAIRSGEGTLEDITAATSIPRSSVIKLLSALEAQGRITKKGTRATRAQPWTIVE